LNLQQSNSEWTATGACTAGKYQGKKPTLVPHYNKIFWYVWSDYFPDGDIFESRESNTASASGTAQASKG